MKPSAALFLLPLLASAVELKSGSTTLSLDPATAAWSLSAPGATVAAHPVSGLLLNNEVPRVVSQAQDSLGRLQLNLETPSGRRAALLVALTPHQLDLTLRPAAPMSVLFRCAPAAPGYGLADHAIVDRPSFDTDITGYDNPRWISGQGISRLVSNFAIYPRHGFALLVWHPGVKIVRSTSSEIAQGVVNAESDVRFSVFLGDPHQIYRQFHESKNLFGYPVLRPKYDFFGVGWEAFGALAWDTNTKTVTENIGQYLALGYPLAWMVVGSGFWPRSEPRFHETTSFGLYDKNLYPDPAAFIASFHAKGLKFFQGLRTTFITDGPYSAEGVEKGYFILENGQPKIFKFGWPKSPCYVLDWNKPEAVAWFADLTRKWTAFGVDGYKEDVFGFERYTLGDDKLDPVNLALMRENLLIMGRNAYLTSAADLHRINDFNYNQDQDRGPVNALAAAYAGFPLVYPDIVGGTFGEGHFDLKVTPKMRTYMMRNATWAALHPSMSMGQGPWTFGDKTVESVLLNAAQLHDRLWPFFYSQAVRWYLDGYPWSMTPLPVAYPNDPQVHHRENARTRGYQWLIGDSLLATPLYGNDYETATTRDVYLPAGTWFEYDSGTRHLGPKTITNYALPVTKTPLFVGGTGILVEKRAGALVARIYPATQKAESVFYHRDGQTRSRITLDVKDWSHPVVLSNGKPIPASWKNYALEFPLTPGADYELH